MLPGPASGGKSDQSCSSAPSHFLPYTHDLTALLRLLKNAGRAVPGEVEQAGLLTRFAIATRYPGLAEPVTRKETEKAIKIADSALRWARKSIGKER
jgi:HEPN domain-containing protein